MSAKGSLRTDPKTHSVASTKRIENQRPRVDAAAEGILREKTHT